MKSSEFIKAAIFLSALLSSATHAQREIKPRQTATVTVDGSQVTYQRGDFSYTRQLHDLNGDGLCDIWCSLFSVDARNFKRDSDLDGDGVTNFQEMILMRDPNVAEEAPEILAEERKLSQTNSKKLPPTIAEIMNTPKLRERYIKATEFMDRSREKLKRLHFEDREKRKNSNRELAAAMRTQNQKDAALIKEHARNLHPGLKKKGAFVHRLDKNKKPVLMQFDMVPIAEAIQADALWPMGSSPLLDTTGRYATPVGVWDQGLAWPPHDDFAPYPGQNDERDEQGLLPVTSRIIGGNSIAELDAEGFASGESVIYFPHATAVTGCLIGKIPDDPGDPGLPVGIAYEATVVSYGSRNDYSEMLEAASAPNGMKFSNHSYSPFGGFNVLSRTGTSTPEPWWSGPISLPGENPNLPIEDPEFGCYSLLSRRIDSVVYETMTYLPIYSASNEAYDLGPSSFPSGFPDYGQGYQYLVDQDLDEDGESDYDNKPRPNDGGNPEDGAYPIPSVPGQPTDEGATPMGLATDTIKSTASAKNNISVGSMDLFSGPAEFISSFRISAFSSRGPTDDGRIKPDLVAQGADIRTSGYNNGFSTTHRTTESGTSFSAPAVTGTLALLESLNNELNGPDYLGSTWKALLLNTATDITTLPPYLGTGAQAADLTGPDYFHGWGMVNAEKAGDVLFSNLVGRATGEHLSEYTLHNDETIEIPFEHDGASSEIRVMICWSDPPYQSSAIAGLDDDVFDPESQLADSDPVTRRLMNDLDMRVITPGGQTLFPWVLDPESPLTGAVPGQAGAPGESDIDNDRDNVEQIVISTPVAGRYTLRINHKGSLKAVTRIKPGEPGYLEDNEGDEIPMFKLESDREQAVSVSLIGNRELFPRLPRITSIVPGANVTLAQVEAILGVAYQIEFSDDAISWEAAGNSSVYPSQFIAEDFPQDIGILTGIGNSADKRFFRIRQIPTLE